jgi:hypothetical protein
LAALRHNYLDSTIDTGEIGGEATCVDLSFNHDGTNYTYWIDAYWSYYGIALSGGDAISETMSLMFALEQPLTEEISLGIAFPIVSKTGNGDPQFIGSFDLYGVMMF